MLLKLEGGGFHSRTHFQQPKASASARKAMPEYQEPMEAAHANRNDMLAHVGNMFPEDNPIQAPGAPGGGTPAPAQPGDED